MANWEYFDKFDEVTNKYLPKTGEGETMATQVVTAICKLVYKWYNDGDVYDNTGCLQGWCNDLSSYANWLAKYVGAGDILDDIFTIFYDDDYELILMALADRYLDIMVLESFEKSEKQGSIYNCEGKFRFIEDDEDEDEECDY